MSIALRPYQEDIIKKCREHMKNGIHSILIQSPTGSGKTLLIAHMLKTASEKGMRSWFIVHRRELIKQSIKAFDGEGVRHGVISAGFREDHRQLVQIAAVQTLAKRYGSIKPPNLICYDEAHHCAASTWKKIYDSFPEAYSIGLTATPQRLDGTGLGRWFNTMINGPSVQWLEKNGYLSPYKMYAPSIANVGAVHVRMGDFVRSELVSVVDKPTITGNAIKEYKKLALGKKAVVFCVSVEHSKHVMQQFNSEGIRAIHVDGETPTEERDDAIRRFSEGEIKVLCNVELFGEGFDLPSLEVAILLRPTCSLGLYLQQVGRALRPSDGKDWAIILDHAGNCQRHGLPDDEREWDLNGTGDKQKKIIAQNSVRICPKCFAAQRPGRPSCQFCGFVFEKESREVAHVEGDLVEVDKRIARIQKLKEQGRAQSLNELVEIGKQRGYKNPYWWAHKVIQVRQAKVLGKAL